MEHKDPRESEESMATTIEAKESLQAQNNAVVTVDVGDKIESSDKYGEGYQSEKHGNGSASEKAREGYLSHESDDTAIPNSAETPVNPEEKTNDTQEEEPLPKMKVMLILTAVTAACFIMFLDTSIVSTVSLSLPHITVSSSNCAVNRQFLVSRINSTPFLTSDGMAVRTYWPSMKFLSMSYTLFISIF